MTAEDSSSPLTTKICATVVAAVTVLSVILIITALATDASAMFGQAVDFYDKPLDTYHILRTNLMGVISFYYLLSVYEEAQKL